MAHRVRTELRFVMRQTWQVRQVSIVEDASASRRGVFRYSTAFSIIHRMLWQRVYLHAICVTNAPASILAYQRNAHLNQVLYKRPKEARQRVLAF